MELAEELVKYRQLKSSELKEKIRAVKSRLGENLVILGHHYQRDDIVELSDFRGDSFKLSKVASEQDQAKYIVFCGVHFMAESAAILARPGQFVFIPDPRAGCPMADMAESWMVDRAWSEIGQATELKKVVPIAYVNSDAELKAFCGRNNGACCTSSNADKLFQWAFSFGEKVFFFPDEHLGRNTGPRLGLSEQDLLVYQPELKLGGANPEQIQRAKVILWKGYCHIHTFFKTDDVARIRKEYPAARIIVHPETPREVVELADATGSTEQIIKYVESQPEGSTIAVGTEIHLVERLAKENSGKRIVIPLAVSPCPNMYKINLANLALTLERLEQGEKYWIGQVVVPEPVRSEAKIALERMLNYG